MELGQDGSVCLIDRTTGARTMVQNFTFEKGMGFLLNPSGTKLLYYNMDSDADGLGITQLGVIDLEKGTFIAFDRKVLSIGRMIRPSVSVPIPPTAGHSISFCTSSDIAAINRF